MGRLDGKNGLVGGTLSVRQVKEALKVEYTGCPWTFILKRKKGDLMYQTNKLIYVLR